MLDLAKVIGAVEGTRQLVITLSPHLKALATQVRPLVIPAAPVKVLLTPALGVLGVGIAIGAGIGILAAPQTGPEARAKLKAWAERRLSEAAAMRKRLAEGRHGAKFEGAPAN